MDSKEVNSKDAAKGAAEEAAANARKAAEEEAAAKARKAAEEAAAAKAKKKGKSKVVDKEGEQQPAKVYPIHESPPAKMMSKQIIKNYGYEVYEYPSGQETREIMIRKKSTPDEVAEAKKNNTSKLNYMASYAVLKGWGVEEGIRELVQNWQDGALKTANWVIRNIRKLDKHKKVTHADFIMVREASTDKERITVYLNGDITARDRWVEPVYKIAWIESDHSVPTHETFSMYNVGITLSLDVLKFGKSIKEDGSAGGFGEGMKLGISTFLYHKINVEISTGGKRWGFYCIPDEGEDPEDDTVDGEVSMKISDAPRTKVAVYDTITRVTTEPLRGLDEFTNHYVDDVELRKALAIEMRVQVKAVFPNWFIYFRPPSDKVVYVNDGALLLEKDDLKYVFVKGIRIVELTMLEFGYNILDMKVPSTRDYISESEQTRAKKKYASIWSEAIAKRPELASVYSDALKKYTYSSADIRLPSSNKGEIAAMQLVNVPSMFIRFDLYQSSNPLSDESAAAVADKLTAGRPGALFVKSGTPADLLLLMTEGFNKEVVCCCGPAEALLAATKRLTDATTMMQEQRAALKDEPDVSGAMKDAEELVNYKRLVHEAPSLLINVDELKVVDKNRETLDVVYAGKKYCIRRELFKSAYAHERGKNEGCDKSPSCLCAMMLMHKLLKKEADEWIKEPELSKRIRERIQGVPTKTSDRPLENERWQKRINAAAEAYDSLVQEAMREKKEVESQRMEIEDALKKERERLEAEFDEKRKEIEAPLDAKRKELETRDMFKSAKNLVDSAKGALATYRETFEEQKKQVAKYEGMLEDVKKRFEVEIAPEKKETEQKIEAAKQEIEKKIAVEKDRLNSQTSSESDQKAKLDAIDAKYNAEIARRLEAYNAERKRRPVV